MNTTEVSIILARKLKISQAAARLLLREKLQQWSESLVNDSHLELPGLGELQVQTSSTRRQYIPSRKEFYLVPEHKRLTFRLNNFFKARLKRRGNPDGRPD